MAVAGVAVVLVLVTGLVVLRRDNRGAGGSSSATGGRWRQLETGPTREPKEAWDEDVDCSSSCRLAVTANTVVVAEMDGDAVDLRALDASSGEERWSERNLGGSSAQLQLVGNVLMVNTFDGSTPEVAAYDVSDGKRRWEVDGSFTGVSDGKVVLVSDSSQKESESIAVSLSDGDERWSGSGYPSGLCDGVAYLVDEGDLVARDLGSGQERWSERMDAEDASAVCGGGGVFITRDDEVRALDPAHGDERWHASLDGASLGPAPIDGTVIAFGSRKVVGLSTAKGEERWSVDADEDLHPFDVYASHRDQALAIPSTLNAAAIVDLATGDDSDHRRLHGVFGMGSNLLVDVDGDELEAYSLDDLRSLWSIGVGDDATVADVGAGSVFVVGSGRLTAYR